MDTLSTWQIEAKQKTARHLENLADLERRLPAIRAELDRLTKYTWHERVTPQPNRYDGTPETVDKDLELTHASGFVVSLTPTDGGKTVKVSGEYPKRRDGSIPYLRDTDHITSINVSALKTDAQIAGHISRRFLPKYEEMYLRLAKECAETDTYRATAKQNAQKLCKALGQPFEKFTYESDTQEKEEYTVYAKRKGVHRVTVSGSRVSFELSLADVDEAIAILAALPRD